MDANENVSDNAVDPTNGDLSKQQEEQQTMSKSAQKKLLKQQKYEAKKAEKKAAEKARRKSEVERKRREWEEKLAAMSEEERLKVIETRKEVRKERMEQRNEEKGKKIERLTAAKDKGQNIVVDLEFSDRMAPNEIHSLVQQPSTSQSFCNEPRLETATTYIWVGSLRTSPSLTRYDGKEVAVEGLWDNWKSRKPLQRSGKDFTIMKVLPSGVCQYRFIVDGQWRYSPDMPWAQDEAGNAYNVLDLQIMYCYAMNIRCTSPAHLWLTGCQGEMGSALEKIPGFDKWIIEKEQCSYIETFGSQKENLVYLTADSETILHELDMSKIYIVGGLVDRNRWKGITMNKAKDQGIQTGKLPIGEYLKMSSSQVLTVNQVIEILLKFLETQDWKASFFQVIPPRKRCEADSEGCPVETEREENERFVQEPKRLCTET